MLGVARLLAGARPARGRIYLLFQPAEETGTGARAVLDDPAFAGIRPDAVFAFHNLPGYPLGQVVVRVITSYSIHYTKLYEVWTGDAGGRRQ